jgi:Flp pilus assembly protein TadD
MTDPSVDARKPGAAVLGAAAVVLAAFWVYGPALRGTWLWDDGLEIARNPWVRSPVGWWKPWVDGSAMDYFPLKDTLQWAQWHLWGGNVLGYHLTNVGLHALCALLLWRVLSRLGVHFAWIGGLLFAVHPVAVESVAWISEFKNPLSLAFLLLAAGYWLDSDAVRPAGPEGSTQVPTLGFHPSAGKALLCFCAALLSKTTVVMFPAGLLLHAWWKRGRITRKDLLSSAPFFAASLVLGSVTLWFQAHRAFGQAGIPAGLGSRLAQAGWSSLLYLGECLFPVGLAPIYGPAGGRLPAILPWLVIAALVGLLWFKRAGFGRPVLFGLGWFGINLVPVLGLVPIAYLRVAPRADHLAYVSLVGLVGLAAAGIGNGILGRTGGKDRGSGRERSRASLLRVLPILCLVGALAWESRSYAGIFRDEASLWKAAVERNPDAWLARNNLGKVLLEAGRPAEAVAQFAQAVRLEPDSAEAHANLGNALQKLGRVTQARAEYREALRIDPAFAGAHYNLGLSFLLSRQPVEAAGEFRAAVAGDPLSAAAHNDLGLALFRVGRASEAIAEYRRALLLSPDLPEAHVNLGNAYFQGGRPADALGEYRRALRANPGYAGAHRNLAQALERLGRYGEARVELEEAERLERLP